MKKKWFYISSIIIASALVVLGVVFLFIVNFNDNVPSAVSIFTSDNKTYIKATLNDNSYGYIFKFKSEEGNTLVETNRNFLCVDTLIEENKMELGKEYKISVQYKNEYENGYSKFSKEVSYLASKFLEAPVVTANADSLSWEEVENADYYDVTYSTGNKMVTVSTMNLFLNFDKLVGGQHNFYVVAKSGKKYFLDSSSSNVVSAETYHSVGHFVSASFDTLTKKLTIVSNEDVDTIEVWLGTSMLDLAQYNFTYGNEKQFKKSIKDNRYHFEIELKLIYTNSVNIIKTKPNVSGYNIYDGQFTDVEII